MAFACCSYGLPEIGIVPGINLAIALDVRSMGVQLGDFLGERTIGTLLGARGKYDWNVKELSNGGMSDDVISKLGGRIIPDLGGLVDGGGYLRPRVELTRWKSPSWRSAMTTTYASSQGLWSKKQEE